MESLKQWRLHVETVTLAQRISSLKPLAMWYRIIQISGRSWQRNMILKENMRKAFSILLDLNHKYCTQFFIVNMLTKQDVHFSKILNSLWCLLLLFLYQSCSIPIHLRKQIVNIKIRPENIQNMWHLFIHW